jgi:hypothetical protein
MVSLPLRRRHQLPTRVKVKNVRNFSHALLISLLDVMFQYRDNFTAASVFSTCTGEHNSTAWGDYTAMLSVPCFKKTKSSLVGRRSIIALVCVSPAAPTLPPPLRRHLPSLPAWFTVKMRSGCYHGTSCHINSIQWYLKLEAFTEVNSKLHGRLLPQWRSHIQAMHIGLTNEKRYRYRGMLVYICSWSQHNDTISFKSTS